MNIRNFVLSTFVISFLGSLFSNIVSAQTSAATEREKEKATETVTAKKKSVSVDATDSAVELETPTGKIFGSLMLPPTTKIANASMPLVVMHSGSGPTDRDGNSALLPGKNDSLKMLAQGLAQNGIASLRYDKRGIGKSSASAPAEKDVRFDNFVDDLAAWVVMMKSDKRFSRFVIAGHSEGSLIGMIAASKTKADGYISIAGISRSMGDVLRTQLKPKLTDALWSESERVLKSLEAGKTVDDSPAALAMLYRPSVQPFLISALSKRPTVEIAKLNVPILILQGTTDIQVAVSEAHGLKTAAPKAELGVIEGMNHVLKKVPLEQPQNSASYGDPTLLLHAELVPRIVKFVETIK
jgi:uncharacterized protein